MRLGRCLLALLLAAEVSGLAGCSSASQGPKLVADPAVMGRSELAFLRTGESTRGEVLLRLGSPSSRFEEDRILVYLVGFEASGRAHLYAPRLFGEGNTASRDWRPGTFSLVLVFGQDGVLAKYTLVPTE